MSKVQLKKKKYIFIQEDLDLPMETQYYFFKRVVVEVTIDIMIIQMVGMQKDIQERKEINLPF